jgi:hypothetical protein
MFEFLGFVVDSLSAILAAIAILLYIIFWYKEKTSTNYDIFDSLYLDLLKTGLEFPSFRNKNETIIYQEKFQGNELIQYDIYAYISWNFIETILDKGDDHLMVTWLPAIKLEASLHEKWFFQPENQLKFKPLFVEQVKKLVLN